MRTKPDQIVALPGFGDEVYIADLRRLAYAWHGGQWSPLYAFASSGTIVSGLARESLRCAELARDTCECGDAAEYPDEIMLRAIADLEKALDTGPDCE